MNIRAYIQDDLPSILDIYSRSKLDELKFEDKTFTLLPLEKDEARFKGLMESDIYVYQEHNLVLGYGALCGDEIRALFVHPNCRGKGAGKELLEFLLSLIEGQPYLYVASSNQPAKGLYQRYNFNVSETFETTYNQQPVMAQKMVRATPPETNQSLS